MTKDIMFNNANVLYDLRFEAVFDERIQDAPRQLTYNPRPDGGSPVTAPFGPPPGRASDVNDRSAASEGPRTRSISPFSPATFPPPPTVPRVYDSRLLSDFMQKNTKVKFVHVQWLDSFGRIRARIVPSRELVRMVQEGERVEISQDEMGLPQKSHSASGMAPPIVPLRLFLEPDLRSLRRTYNDSPLPAATVFSYCRDEAGNAAPQCPRNNLEVLISGLQYNYTTTLVVGLHVQVTLLPTNERTRKITSEINPVEALQRPVFTDTIVALDESEIEVQQYFPGFAPGQYNFTLAPQPPLLAVDTYIQTRQIITQIAAQHDMQVVFHSRPNEGTVNPTTQANISLHPPERDMQFFVGGVLAHLPALCAFSMPENASYNTSPSAQWVAWSTQSADTPLRRSKPGKWDIRCLDGAANMYSTLSAFIAAGLLGLASGELQFAQLDAPPYPMEEQTRAQYGVMQPMPRSAEEALEALQRDGALTEALAPGVVAEYIRMRVERMRADEETRTARVDKGKRRVEDVDEGTVPRLPDLKFGA